MRGRLILSGLLGLAVLVSALSLVFTKHEHRALFVELQQMQRQRDNLDVEWGKLQLEQSTWGAHGRIEKVARKRLKMSAPRLEEIVVVKQ